MIKIKIPSRRFTASFSDMRTQETDVYLSCVFPLVSSYYITRTLTNVDFPHWYNEDWFGQFKYST